MSVDVLSHPRQSVRPAFESKGGQTPGISLTHYLHTLMYFELVGQITEIETIAIGSSIYEISRLRRIYGAGRWRKLKGKAMVRLSDGTIRQAEIHWYEAHGIGRKELKLKRILRG